MTRNCLSPFHPKQSSSSSKSQFSSDSLEGKGTGAGKLRMHSFKRSFSASWVVKIPESSPLVALFSTNEDNKLAWISVGRSFERVALTATSLNIQHAHLNQPLEIPDMRGSVQSALGNPKQHAQLLLRMGHAKPLPFSLRRCVEDVLVETVDSLLSRRMTA